MGGRLVGDCARVLRTLVSLLDQRKDRSFLEKAQAGMKEWNELMVERGTRTDKPMKPQVVAHELNKLLNDDAIVATDSGTITTWIARHLSIRASMMFSAPAISRPWPAGCPTRSPLRSPIRAAKWSLSSATAGLRC
jgi:pyruvate dehydrogenase (quinone)/pyruvate oxidase